MNNWFTIGRRAMAIGVSIGLASAALAPAHALTQVRVSVLPIFDTANVYAAIQEGYFKDEGLDVTTQSNQQGGTVGIPGVVAGAYDFAYSATPSILMALQQGLELRIIGGTAGNGKEPPDPAALLVRKGENLQSGKDLEGKTIAVNARNSVQWLFARGWVKAKGGDPDKVTYREVPVPQMIDALKQKQADAAFSIDPFMTVAIRDPAIEVLGWPLSTVLPGTQVANYVVTAETATKRAEVVDGFIRAMRKGAIWINANTGKEPFFKLVNAYTKMDPALIAAMVTKPSQLESDVASVQRVQSLMRENGMLSGPEIDIAAIMYKPRP
jgi:NitT/TauT family transport system substrate-binding protein